MVPDDVVFFAEEERYGNGMDLRAEQDARIRFGTDGFLAAAEEVDSTAEELLRRIEEGACRQDVRIGLDALCGNPVREVDDLVVMAEVHGLAVEIAFIVHEVCL